MKKEKVSFLQLFVNYNVTIHFLETIKANKNFIMENFI